MIVIAIIVYLIQKEQADSILNAFQELNPQATLVVVDVYSLDNGDTYQVSE